MRKTIDSFDYDSKYYGSVVEWVTVPLCTLEREIVHHDNLQHLQDPIKSCVQKRKIIFF